MHDACSRQSHEPSQRQGEIRHLTPGSGSSPQELRGTTWRHKRAGACRARMRKRMPSSGDEGSHIGSEGSLGVLVVFLFVPKLCDTKWKPLSPKKGTMDSEQRLYVVSDAWKLVTSLRKADCALALCHIWWMPDCMKAPIHDCQRMLKGKQEEYECAWDWKRKTS